MPFFGLPYEHRRYECTLCGHEQMIGTNHTDVCFDHCQKCSWKGMRDPVTGNYHRPGYRAFRHKGDPEEEDKLMGTTLESVADRLLERPSLWSR